MKLTRLTERIWYYPFEEERDRPNLGYIRGDSWSLAVDAGHSENHVHEFYRALEEAGLPFPQLTVLTHWHWDHTFGMHAVHGLCVANGRTTQYLGDFRDRLQKEGSGFYLAMNDSIRQEYRGEEQVIVTLPDIIFQNEIRLDAGSCPVRIFQADSPHTDDSTLIEVPDDRVLFVGDAPCGTFPDGRKDRSLCHKLGDAIRRTNADICLEGHWIPISAAEETGDLMGT